MRCSGTPEKYFEEKSGFNFPRYRRESPIFAGIKTIIQLQYIMISFLSSILVGGPASNSITPIEQKHGGSYCINYYVVIKFQSRRSGRE